ncbi:oxidoreductase - protein [Fusarium austroafricanum]|uniref:Oxidoreductase - protein n=1 Tax=Fusarium austroafricanum TaxID=2364996 RepID=A0A8H4KD54_9HYPO|nr:oxidoreductase - protein [Fusarium austroafricanum]
MSQTIKTVAQASASGSLGTAVLKELVQGGFEVVVLSRKAGQVSSEYSTHVKEIVVDYEDPESLRNALTGVDAVVSTLGAPAVGVPQRALVDAAIASGVQRFIPSNFGCDQENPLTRKLPVFAEKVKTEDYLVEKSRTSSISYTFVYNNLFLDWGLTYGSLANLKTKDIAFYNGGDLPISVTRLTTVGKGIVGALKNATATKNRSIRIEDGKISSKELAAILQDALPGSWNIRELDTDKIKADSDEALKNGIMDKWVWLNYIFVGGYDAKYGCSFQNVDNDLVGLPSLTKDEMEAFIRRFAVESA